tara:strand:+ start:170 stop:1249 length:1080 start_codon:yes stop_codon:yes gene_type:complete
MKSKGKKLIGWVVTDQLDSMPYWPRIDTGVGGVSLARLHWIASRINSNHKSGLHYEIYRPWKRYDALIFLKAMGTKAIDLASRYLDNAKPVIFDANVNYYTIEGVEHYEGMLPTLIQQKDAVAMTRISSAVIADSEHIAGHCRRYNSHVNWIPDNVEIDHVPELDTKVRSTRPRFVWSGDALKLFELLLIEDVLRAVSDHCDIVLVTGDLSVMGRWNKSYKQRLEKMLADLNVVVIKYKGIKELFNVYGQADVVLSPRFLDNSYNMGHTEWKITLGMACGCVALASPLPSYQDVWECSSGREIMLCSTIDEWYLAIDKIIGGQIDYEVRALSRNLVNEHYSSRTIARKHAEFLHNCLLS